MTDTPRTDAAELATMNPSYEFESAEVEAWEFARRLERELAETQSRLDHAEAIIDKARDKASEVRATMAEMNSPVHAPEE